MNGNCFVHKISLSPNDVLFFKDSRPMTGASHGIGNRLPLPHTFNGAMRDALCDSSVDRRAAEGLLTVGPFMERANEVYVKTPSDILCDGDSYTLLTPSKSDCKTSLPSALSLLVSDAKPSKRKTGEFISASAFLRYLGGTMPTPEDFADFSDFCSDENYIGIKVDTEKSVAEDGMFFSKTTLRMRRGSKISGYAKLVNRKTKEDLLAGKVSSSRDIRFGGEGGMCKMEFLPADEINLPYGASITSPRVKFVLLIPAVFIAEEGCCGGWQPNWIRFDGVLNQYGVKLLDGPGEAKAKRLRVPVGRPINARLVAVRTEKPLCIGGWGGGSADAKRPSGAKSSLLAVPAGSVYYFEADSVESANSLADALNWHGVNRGDGSDRRDFVNLRSALLGEKGYGIGVCGNWDYYKGEI